MMDHETKQPILIGVGMPANLKLELFALLVRDAFGDAPYLVGSAVYGKTWRDVDVRLILSDEQYDALFGNIPIDFNRKLMANELAFAALGKEMTGLPIDFQIQRQTEVNAQYPGRFRQPLIAYGTFIEPAKPCPTCGQVIDPDA